MKKLRYWRHTIVTSVEGSTVIHLWVAPLDVSATEVSSFANVISPDEIQRARRFYFESDRRRFIVTHGLLRTLLGWVLTIAPAQVQLCYGPNGKPAMSEAHGDRSIRFSLAHSHDLALIGITRGREIGVDIEQIIPMQDLEGIGHQCLSDQERTALDSLSVSDRNAAFFTYWTRKEALVKAIGTGLTFPLCQLDTSAGSRSPISIINAPQQNQEDQGEPTYWLVQDLNVARSHAASIAIEVDYWVPCSRRPKGGDQECTFP